MTMRVAIYTRISTDEENQPFSLGAQTTALERYVGSQDDWSIVRRYEDQASGAKLDRPGLERALRDAEAGRYDVLLVYRLDRLARSVGGSVKILERLDSAGVSFRSATEPFETETPSGRMMMQMLSVFAEHERALIIDRVSSGLSRKASQGRWVCGPPPFGYVLAPDGSLTVEPSEGVIVHEVFRRYAERLEGARGIANWLNERGYCTRKGKTFDYMRILRMLRSRTYLGEIVWRGESTPDAHEAIVSADLYDRVQKILDERGEYPALRRSNASDFLLTGLVKCAGCGRKMIGTTAHGRSRKYAYYTCFTRHRYGTNACATERIPARELEQAVLDQLVHVLEQEPVVRAAVEDALATLHADRPRREADLLRIQDEYAPDAGRA